MGTDFQISVVNMKVFIILGFLTFATAAPPIQPRAQTCAKVPSWMKSAFTSFDRIVGGANAGSAIPWQVSLRNSASGSTHFCGGTILDANTVLSAAHCFHNGHQGVVVVAGSHKRSDNTGVQTSTISKSIYNQDAKYNKANMDNDIIILKLTTALKFNKNVQPACLPKKNFDAPEKSKSMAVVSGWGTTKSGGSLPDILQYVNVPLMTNADCKKTGYEATSIKPSMVCAGYKEGKKDSCQGDSGGPLVVPKSKSDDTAIIYGVVSWGAGCASPDLPGVYARVTKFIDWIKKNMNSSNGTPSTPPPSTSAPPSSSSSTTKKSTTTSSDDYGNYGTYGTYGRADYDDMEDEYFGQ